MPVYSGSFKNNRLCRKFWYMTRLVIRGGGGGVGLPLEIVAILAHSHPTIRMLCNPICVFILVYDTSCYTGGWGGGVGLPLEIVAILAHSHPTIRMLCNPICVFLHVGGSGLRIIDVSGVKLSIKLAGAGCSVFGRAHRGSTVWLLLLQRQVLLLSTRLVSSQWWILIYVFTWFIDK